MMLCLNEGLFDYNDIVVGSKFCLTDGYIDEVCYVDCYVIVVFNLAFREMVTIYDLNTVHGKKMFCRNYGLSEDSFNLDNNWIFR